MRTVAAFILLLTPLAASADPTCDPAGIQTVVKAIGAAPAEQTSSLLAAGLDEVCTGTSLSPVANAAPETRQMLLAKAVSEDPSGWIAGCTGGVDVIIKSAVAAPEERPALLVSGCQLDRFGIDAAVVGGWKDDAVLRITALGLISGVSGEPKQALVAAIKAPVP